MRFKLLSVFLTQIVMGVLILLMLFPQTGILFQGIRIFFSCLLLLYLPGYWIGYIFFSEDSLSAFERFITSFLISITLVVLVSYYLYFAASSVSSIKVYIITSIIILTSILVVLIRRRGYGRNQLFEDLDEVIVQ